MKDPLAGYFQAGGNVGFRRKPRVGGGANPGVPSPVGQDVLGPIQNQIPNPSSSAPPVPSTSGIGGPDESNRDDPDGVGSRGTGVIGDDGTSYNHGGRLFGNTLGDLFGGGDGLGGDGRSTYDEAIASGDYIPGGYEAQQTVTFDDFTQFGDSRTGQVDVQNLDTRYNEQGYAPNQAVAAGLGLQSYAQLGAVDVPGLGQVGLLPGQGLAGVVGDALIGYDTENIRGTDTITTRGSFDVGSSEQGTDYSGGAVGGNVATNPYGSTVSQGYGYGQVDPNIAAAAGYTSNAGADYAQSIADRQSDVGGTTVTQHEGRPGSFIDTDGDGIQDRSERSAVTSTDGTAVQGGSGVVTSRSQDELDYGGTPSQPSQYSAQEIADWAAAHPDIVNDPAALAAVQAEYGVSPAEFAAATGSDTSGAEQRNREDIDAGYSSGNWDTGSTGYHDYEAQAYDVPAAAPEPPAPAPEPEPAPAPDPSLGASLSPQQIASHISANPALSSDPAALQAAMEAYGVSASQVDAATGGLAADLGVDTTSISRSSGWDNSGGGHGDYGGGTGDHVDSEGDSWGSSPFAEGGMVHEDEYIRRIYERLFG